MRVRLNNCLKCMFVVCGILLLAQNIRLCWVLARIEKATELAKSTSFEVSDTFHSGQLGEAGSDDGRLQLASYEQSSGVRQPSGIVDSIKARYIQAQQIKLVDEKGNMRAQLSSWPGDSGLTSLSLRGPAGKSRIELCASGDGNAYLSLGYDKDQSVMYITTFYGSPHIAILRDGKTVHMIPDPHE